MSTSAVLEAQITPYEYIGDIPALGSIQLTMLARSFEQLETGSLSDLFPETTIEERTIVIEQTIEGLGIMPIVRFGVPGGGFVEPDRVRSMRVSPAVVREEDFIEMSLVNQLRQVGTMNQRANPQQIIADRMQKLMNRRQRTMELFQARVLLGGVSYTDDRTGVTIDVSTNIPAHNIFRYDGWGGPGVASVQRGQLVGGGYDFTAYMDLVGGAGGRPEAMMFTSTDGQCGVPWTHPRADIPRTVRLLKQYLYRTNKNKFTEILISSELKTVIEENEVIKAHLGQPSILVNLDQNVVTSTTNRDETNALTGTSTSTQSIRPGLITAHPGGVMVPQNARTIRIGPDGELMEIAGLRVRTVDGLYRDPNTRLITNFWPANKVAIVAPRHFKNPAATLGMTQHCMGEAPDGTPGVYVRTSDDAPPPSPPGRVMQVGDAFLPFAVYPHWICLLTVCELADITSRLILGADVGYGTF